MQGTLPARAVRPRNARFFALPSCPKRRGKATRCRSASSTPRSPDRSAVRVQGHLPVLLDRDNGPKPATFLLPRRDFVAPLLGLPLDKSKFWEETGVTNEAEQWIGKEKSNIASLSDRVAFLPLDGELAPGPPGQLQEQGLGVIEFFVAMSDGKPHCRRVLFDQGKGLANLAENESQRFNVRARQGLEELEKRLGIEIRVET